MKKKLRIALIAVLSLVLLGSLAMLLRHQLEYQAGDASYQEAAEIIELPELEPVVIPAEIEELDDTPPRPLEGDPNLAVLQLVDLERLRETNSDVVGWIVIPGTKISYPILQGEDNAYYLTHTWQGSANSVGAIFLDSRNSGDFSDFNTIIYGHRMRNGSMFAGLKYYRDQDYWRGHPDVYIVLDSGVYRYEIYAAYEAGVTTATYTRSAGTQEEKEAIIRHGMEHSNIETKVAPTAEDSIITLSTCTGNGYATRWVVQAVRTETVS